MKDSKGPEVSPKLPETVLHALADVAWELRIIRLYGEAYYRKAETSVDGLYWNLKHSFAMGFLEANLLPAETQPPTHEHAWLSYSLMERDQKGADYYCKCGAETNYPKERLR